MHSLIYLKLLLISLFLSPFVLQGKDWSLEDPSRGWNSRELVTLYFHNSELQTQWAWEALSHYSFRGNEHVLDFGAGDGKLSALISFMVAKGSVTATDISEEMIHYASNLFPPIRYKNLTFSHTPDVDFGTAVFEHPFDLVTSFCVFNVIPHPVLVLKNLKKQMHAGSRLVLTFPIGGNLEFIQAAKSVMQEQGLNFPSLTSGTKAMRDPTQTPLILQEAGFKLLYFKVIDTKNAFGSKEELINWFEGTLGPNWDIPASQRRLFFVELADRYLQLRPDEIGENGFVHFSLKRIDLIATPME